MEKGVKNEKKKEKKKETKKWKEKRNYIFYLISHKFINNWNITDIFNYFCIILVPSTYSIVYFQLQISFPWALAFLKD